MSNIQNFNNPEFGSIRTIKKESGVWFVGKDVAEVLGYTNPQKAIRDHVGEEDVRTERIVHPSGGEQETRVINESGLYSLILCSKLPSAKRFKRWVTHEVLPAIRRDGGYMVARENETPEEVIARALLLANDALKRKDRLIEEMRPKALFADAVGASDGTVLIGELAKMMRQNGIPIGQNRLFSLLREDGYLGKCGSNYNVPTQRAMEQCLFRIKETAITHADGHITLQRTPKVTGRGQQYFMKKYANIADSERTC